MVKLLINRELLANMKMRCILLLGLWKMGSACIAADTSLIKVSSFGWNGKDDTAAIQKAIDSGVSTVLVDRVAGAWVTRPLFARSNQTLLFERGSVLEAKEGEFLGMNDSLFTCDGVSNLVISGYGATWRMHRAHYDAAPYKKGEWRHSLKILACSDVTVEGLTLLESGGDGVYVGTNDRQFSVKKPSTDIILRDLVCDRHYRQGISIITARRLLIERCIMRNTRGTPPAAGIDFEPNHFSEELTDCVMRDCVSENNQGCGIEMFFGQLNAKTPPLSIAVENFRSRNNKRGVTIATYFKDTYPQGNISFLGCEFVNEAESGLTLLRKPASSLRVVFENCLFENCQSAATRIDNVQDIHLASRKFDDPTTDGLVLQDCTIRIPVEREWITRAATSLAGKDVHAISGTVNIVTPASSKRVVLNERWCKEYFSQPTLAELPPTIAFDASRARPKDRCPGKSVKLDSFAVRHHAKYRFYAASAGTVHFVGTIAALGRNRASFVDITVRDESGREVRKIECSAGENVPFTVRVPSSGFYVLDVPAGRQTFSLERSDVPVALDLGNPVNVLSSSGTMRIRVEGGVKMMVAVAGDGAEHVHAVLRNPFGKTVWDEGGISGWRAYGSDCAEQGIWTLNVGPSARAPYEDCTIALKGIQGAAFLSDEKIW